MYFFVGLNAGLFVMLMHIFIKKNRHPTHTL